MDQTPPQRSPRAALCGAALIGLCWCLAVAPAAPPAGSDWADWRVAGPFVCRADFSLAGYESLLGDLAQLQADLARYLDLASPKESIEIYLFRDEPTYRAYLKHYLPSIPYRRALYLKQGGPGIVLAYRSRQLATDLRHECTHALLHAALPMVPLWLDEGLAEYFEVAPAERAYGNPHLSQTRWNARLGIRPSLGKLEKKNAIEQMKGTDYRNAWAWVHFMLHGPAEAHNQLTAFLNDIASGVPPGYLSRRLQRRVPRLEKQFLAHFRGWKPPVKVANVR